MCTDTAPYCTILYNVITRIVLYCIVLYCKQVVATDVNLEMLQMAKDKHKDEVGDAGPAVEIMASDAEALVFPDSSFDVVVDTFGKKNFRIATCKTITTHTLLLFLFFPWGISCR